MPSFILKMSLSFLFWKIFGWDVRFCCSSWFSFLVLLDSLQQDHDLGFSFPFHTTPSSSKKWCCGSSKIGILGWINRISFVRSVVLFFVGFFLKEKKSLLC